MLLGRVKAGLVALVAVVAQDPRVSESQREKRFEDDWETNSGCGLLELLFAAMQAHSSNHSGGLVT